MHDFKHIFEFVSTSFAEALWPTRCVGCDLPGTLLCPSCRAKLPLIDPATACPRCGAPWGGLVCTECFDAHGDAGDAPHAPAFPFSATRAALSFESVGAALVTCYKDAGERRLAPLLAALLTRAMCADGAAANGAPACTMHPVESWEGWADALVAIPPRADALRRCGFDHLAPVAERTAQWLSVPLLHPLAPARATLDQRALDPELRQRNLSGSFAVTDASSLPGARIVLVDDVLTTGATTSAAAEALLAGGAAEVRVAVVARVW